MSLPIGAAVAAGVVTFGILYFGVPLTALSAGPIALRSCALVAAAIAAGFVIMGESAIEDGVKIALFLLLSGLIAILKRDLAFLFPSAAVTCSIGAGTNYLVRRIQAAASHREV